MLCWSLPHSSVDQPQVYMYPLPPEAPSHPPPLLRVLSEPPAELPGPYSASHRPAVSHAGVCVCVSVLPVSAPPPTLPRCVHKSVLHVCISVPALQTVLLLLPSHISRVHPGVTPQTAARPAPVPAVLQASRFISTLFLDSLYICINI